MRAKIDLSMRSVLSRCGWLLQPVLASASLLLLSTLLDVAIALPPSDADPNSPMGLWFRSLTVPRSGLSCCSIADCRVVEARLAGDHWEVRAGDSWMTVSPEVVLRRDNPDGRPVACLQAGAVRCFVPPAAT
jgi:hypothetical protein